ncbi:hypothetical protein ANTRET_LOCUS4640 [Anthophora retusa]
MVSGFCVETRLTGKTRFQNRRTGCSIILTIPRDFLPNIYVASFQRQLEPSKMKVMYSTSVREPGYDAPAFVEELYCGPARPANNSCYYHQPIYEDEVPDYVAPFPVYAPLSVERTPTLNSFNSTISQNFSSRKSQNFFLFLFFIFKVHYIPDYRSRQDYRSMEQENYMVQIVPPPHLDLNTYGHLKIDYTNSWNSLNRKISK